MDMKSMEQAVSGLSTAIDSKFAQYDQQMAEMKNAFSVAPQKKNMDVEFKAFQDYLCGKSAAPALTTTSANAGAVAIPAYEGNSILDRIKDENPILGAVHHVTVNGSAGLNVPVFTSEVAPDTVSENGSVGLTNATLAMKEIALGKTACKTQYSIEMANCYDPYNFAEEISRQVVAEMGQSIANKVSTTIMNDQYIADVTSAAAAKVTYNDLCDLMGAVPAKCDANGKFVMNRDTFFKIVKEFGTASGYVQMPLSAEQKPMILGHEVLMVPTMESVAATKKTVMYGDFDASTRYVTAGGIEVLPDRYTGAGNGLINLWSYALTGIGVVRPEGIALLTQHAA